MNLDLLKSSNIRGGLTVTGNISGNNLRTSFNQGSATGDYSFAEGSGKAIGDYSHAEGEGTVASDYAAHAEGDGTTASGDSSHAEGFDTQAIGYDSHAEGASTVAFGDDSHAAGFRATAAQNYTYAWSDGELGTLTENVSTTRSGQYMVNASGGVFIPGSVGIGTDSIDNALTVVGNLSTTGTITTSALNIQTVSLSTITLTSETTTQAMSSTNTFIRVVVNGVDRYLPLFALSAI